MSLLMEALRKAEEAKRKIQTQNPDSLTGFSIAPAQPDIAPVPVLSATPEPAFTRNAAASEVNADYITDNFLRAANNESASTQPAFSSSTARSKSSRASVEELQSYLETAPEPDETLHASRREVSAKHAPNPEQRAAGAIFAAKQKPVQSNRTRNVLLIALALIVPAGAAVLWYLASPGNSSILVDPALLAGNSPSRSLSDELYAQQESAAQDTAPSSTAPAQELNVPAEPESEIAAASPPSIVAEELDAAANSALVENQSTTTSVVQPPAALTARETPADLPSEVSAVQETPAANSIDQPASGQVLEVSHSAGTSKNNQQLLDAYTSLQAGDVAAASMLYRQVLEQFPTNRDALLGNAAIAMRQGDLLQAREFYSRLMQLNPKDPLARTGLLQTVQEIDQTQHEQELQRLVQQYPGIAPLSFAIGNLYAAQHRWNEAQSAYFDAFLFARQSNDGAINPDYAYNLAVSLERLNQPKAALDYYRQAQALAAAVSPGFDLQELSRRISFLERNFP